jgi:hypothetical protein
MRGEAEVTILQTYCISLPHDTVLWTCFYTSAFSTSCSVLSIMNGKIKQCVCVKFCRKLGKSATKTLEMLCETFGEHSLSQTAVFEWHSRFEAGWVSVEDNEHSEWPSTSKTTTLKNQELIHEDRHRTIHELADTAGISYGVCQESLTENLNMHRIATKFVLFPYSWQMIKSSST